MKPQLGQSLNSGVVILSANVRSSPQYNINNLHILTSIGAGNNKQINALNLQNDPKKTCSNIHLVIMRQTAPQPTKSYPWLEFPVTGKFFLLVIFRIKCLQSKARKHKQTIWKTIQTDQYLYLVTASTTIRGLIKQFQAPPIYLYFSTPVCVSCIFYYCNLLKRIRNSVMLTQQGPPVTVAE